MKRNVRLEDISDGKLYTANDLVKADCHDCEGCSACCRGMASIVLDPYDVWQLCMGLGKTFQGLMEEHIELQVVDGGILPKLKMAGEEESCTFLDENGRCSIHLFRPGICRLFHFDLALILFSAFIYLQKITESLVLVITPKRK